MVREITQSDGVGNWKLRNIFTYQSEKAGGWTKLLIEEFAQLSKIFMVKKSKITRLVLCVAHV
jgi:hypothetical protein